MSHELSKTQAKDIMEKAAIIANTAFKLGLETEGRRILDLLNSELVLHKRGSTGATTIQRCISKITGEQTDGSN